MKIIVDETAELTEKGQTPKELQVFTVVDMLIWPKIYQLGVNEDNKKNADYLHLDK